MKATKKKEGKITVEMKKRKHALDQESKIQESLIFWIYIQVELINIS